MAEEKNPSSPDPICIRFDQHELLMVDSAAALADENRSTFIRRVVIRAIADAVVEQATR